MRRAVREVLKFLGETLNRCVLHSVDTQSAALAFYSLFSLAPVLLAVVSIARRLFGDGPVHVEIARQLQGIMGPEAGLAAAVFLEKAVDPGNGTGAVGVAGIVAFVLGATAVFLQLQEALNRVWEVSAPSGPMLRSLLKRRLVSFLLVLAVGLLLIASLTISAGLTALTDLVDARTALPLAFITLGNEVLSLLVLAGPIALVYRVLPDTRLEWRDVWIGAVVTSVLFSFGKWLIGTLLAHTGVASQFGVAGSLVVILLWVYYESYILLFGAEATAVYSGRRGRRPASGEARPPAAVVLGREEPA